MQRPFRFGVLCEEMGTREAWQAKARRAVARLRGWSNISAEEILKMPTFFIGTVDKVAEQVLERRKRFGISYSMAFDHVMEAFAPLVARLTGR